MRARERESKKEECVIICVSSLLYVCVRARRVVSERDNEANMRPFAI